MDRSTLESLSREELIEIILAQGEAIAGLTKRVEELEVKLGLPPKTPENSSVPPSQGRKAGREPKRSGNRRKGPEGRHRSLDPNPTRRLEVRAACCPHCRADVSGAAMCPCESYDHIEIPPIRLGVTRVVLQGAPVRIAPGASRQHHRRTCPPARRSGRTCAASRCI